jgi:hypothetical protein
MTADVARTLSMAEQHEWFRQQRSRRAILKGGLASAGAVLAGPALLGSGQAGAAVAGLAGLRRTAPFRVAASSASPSSGASVVPFGRHISFGADPTSVMRIAWQVSAPVTNPFVRVGLTALELGERIGADLRTVTTPWADITDFLDSVPPAASAAKLAQNQYYVHAEVGMLLPNTRYFYSVGHDGLDPASSAGSVAGSFTTAPRGARPFTFTAFGDQGISYDAVATTNLILAQDPAFHLHAGDVSYAENGGDGLLTDSYDPRAWDSYFVETAPTASRIPWMVALGNHEMEPWYSPDGYGADIDRFDFPGNGPSACPGTYLFRYGNAAFISLDANDVSYEIPANNGYSGGAQTAWLSSTLAALRKDAGVDFIVVYFHHCAYCSCTAHGSEGGVQQYWVPLFDRYEVDLVINGHNHLYERTDPLKAGVATGAAPIGSVVTPATQGTTYVTCGGAGKSLYAFSAADSYEGDVAAVSSVSAFVNEAGGTTTTETVNWSRVRYTGYCLLVGQVTPPDFRGSTTLVLRGLDEQGNELDRITLSRTS